MKHLILPLSLICFCFFMSCGSHEKPATVTPASGKFNFAFLRYDSTALEYRLDSVHNRGLELQLLLRDAGNNNTAFQLISYAFDTLRDYNNSWIPDTLSIVQDSLPVNFTERIVLGFRYWKEMDFLFTEWVFGFESMGGCFALRNLVSAVILEAIINGADEI